MQYDYVIYQNAPTANKQEWVSVTKEEKEWFIDSFKMERAHPLGWTVSAIFAFIGVMSPISAFAQVDWKTVGLSGLYLVAFMGIIGALFLFMGWMLFQSCRNVEQQATWMRTHEVFKARVRFVSKNVHGNTGNYYVRVADDTGHNLETGFAVSEDAYHGAEDLEWWLYFYKSKHRKWHVWLVEDGPVGRPLNGMW